MTTVRAGTWLVIGAPVAAARAAVADYRHVRPRILPPAFRDYEVVEGGTGAGTVAAFGLRVARRDHVCVVDVTQESPGHLVEVDRGSHLVFRWSVDPTQDGRSMVSVQASWTGGEGVGGAAERLLAPTAYRRVLDGLLRRLERELARPL